MKDQFVSYEEALGLKELGFNEPCFGYYKLIEGLHKPYLVNTELRRSPNNYSISAPLWQQTFDWFRKEYNLIPYIDFNKRNSKFGFNIIRLDGPLLMKDFDTYEEARLACLVKLIELVKR